MSSLDEVKRVLVDKIYEYAIDPQSAEEMPGTMVFGFLSGSTGKPLIRAAVRELIEEDLIFDLTTSYIITPKLIRLAEQKDSADIQKKEDIPAADRFVTLDHNSRDYVEAVAALEEIKEKAPRDNVFCDLIADEAERAVILSEVDTALDWLSKPKVRVAAFTAAILPLLSWLAKALADGAIKELAKKAIEHLGKLFS